MNRILLTLLMATSVAAMAQTLTTKPAAKPTAPAAKPAAPVAKAAPATAILGNKDSKVYHRADCKMAGKMKEAHKVAFASAAEADKAGYKPCKVCKP